MDPTLGEMLLEVCLEVWVLRSLRHFGQGFHGLPLGGVDVLESVEEDVVEWIFLSQDFFRGFAHLTRRPPPGSCLARYALTIRPAPSWNETSVRRLWMTTDGEQNGESDLEDFGHLR